jgi:DNA invertase Pin-like site-specific DNA recombinase
VNPPTENKPIGIWIRVSTADQAKGESPLHHEERARAYCLAKGWTVVACYDLSGVSGKAVLKHREAQRMLADLRAGHIRALVFSRLARLARNVIELRSISDDFRSHGADLVSLQESIDTATPAGRMFYTILSAFAEFEREEIVGRVTDGLASKAKKGELIGTVPYGFDAAYRFRDGHEHLSGRALSHGLGQSKEDQLAAMMVAHGDLVECKLVDNPAEQGWLRIMVDLRRAGWAYNQIAHRLNGANVPTKIRGLWKSGNVARILNNRHTARWLNRNDNRNDAPEQSSPLQQAA